jgi:hypothetical protein
VRLPAGQERQRKAGRNESHCLSPSSTLILVGFFFAENADDLELIVDECTDVPDCEYVELPDGGIMWESPAIDVPFQFDKDGPEPADEDEVPKVPWSGASLTESWWSVFYGYTDEQWARFVPEDPLKARPPAPRRPLGPGRVMKFRRRGA